MDEKAHPEFQLVAEGLAGLRAEAPGGPMRAPARISAHPLPRRTFVSIIEKPSKSLSAFLGLSAKERQQGVVLKGRSYRPEFGQEHAAWEVHAMQRHIPKHPLFFSLLKAFRSSTTDNVYLVLPRACCDLSQYYRDAPRSIDVRFAAAEMAASLHRLHQLGFLHRDVKPPNYFVSQTGHIQLADFEMLWPSNLPCPPEEATHTRGFTAPELRHFDSFLPFSIKTDVYALGMALARLIVMVHRFQRIPDEAALVTLVLKMVESDIEKRIDLETVMADPYFAGIDWQQVEAGKGPPPCPLAPQVTERFTAARQKLRAQELARTQEVRRRIKRNSRKQWEQRQHLRKRNEQQKKQQQQQQQQQQRQQQPQQGSLEDDQIMLLKQLQKEQQQQQQPQQ